MWSITTVKDPPFFHCPHTKQLTLFHVDREASISELVQNSLDIIKVRFPGWRENDDVVKINKADHSFEFSKGSLSMSHWKVAGAFFNLKGIP